MTELRWMDRVLLDMREAKDLDELAIIVNKRIDNTVYAWLDRQWMKEAVLQFVRIANGRPARDKNDPIPEHMQPTTNTSVVVTQSRYTKEEYDAWDKANPPVQGFT